MLSEVHRTLDGMRVEQYLAGYLFFGSYALSLSSFIGQRGRRIAIVLAAASVVVFAARTDPWEYGVMLVAIALLVMGLFMLLAWGAWALFERSTWQAAVAFDREVDAIKRVSIGALWRHITDVSIAPARRWARL